MSGRSLSKALLAGWLVALAMGVAAQTPGKVIKKHAPLPSTAAAPAKTTAAASAAAVPAAPDDATEYGFEQLRKHFAVSPAWQADAVFKGTVADIAEAHIQRVSALIPGWVAEERASSSGPLGQNELKFRLYRRQINEIALNHLESAGDAFDEAWLAVFSRPGACRVPADVQGFVARMSMLEKLPPVQRDAALAGERVLLSRWGTVREGVPPRSGTPIDAQVAQKVGQIKAGGKRDGPPMSPQLAYRLLTPADESPLHWKERCELARWWLSMQPTGDASSRRKVLDELRYTTLLGIADFDAQGRDSVATSDLVDNYAPLASRYHVEGLVTLQLSIDAEGKLQRAEVLRREIEVPGIRGNRPVAFETLLDAAALARAANGRYAKPAPKHLKAGVMLAEQEFEFTLSEEKSGAPQKD